MECELGKKVKHSIRLLKLFRDNYDGEIELAYSGGKDSDVILALTKLADVKVRPIYKETTISPPGTIAHVREMGGGDTKAEKGLF